jgi:hypothetical protein
MPKYFVMWEPTLEQVELRGCVTFRWYLLCLTTPCQLFVISLLFSSTSDLEYRLLYDTV